MSAARHPVLTIGHSRHSLEAFVALLRQNGVTALADVRSAPFSRFNPQFNRDALEQSLKAHSIKYVFLGRELGARSDDRSCYENGRVRYTRLARTDLFRRGIERVVRGANEHRVALMTPCRDRCASPQGDGTAVVPFRLPGGTNPVDFRLSGRRK